MRLVIKAFIPGTPKPKERPRGHINKDGTIGFRSGKSTSAWEKHARQILQFTRQQAGMHGPVPRDVPLRLDALIVFKRVGRLGDGARVRHIVTPDADNVLKAVKDALDGGKPAKGSRPGTPGLIVTDDCQITSVSASKWYAATGEKAGVHLRLWRLDQHPDIGPDDPARTDKPASGSGADIGPDDPARTDSSPSSSGSLSVSPHEIWRPIQGQEGFYEVSNLGRVRSLDRVLQYVDGRTRPCSGVVLRTSTVPKGGHLQLSLGDRLRYVYVHHLVLAAFVGERPPGMVCRHMDGDPTNNRVENLKWGTSKENAQDTLRHGRTTQGTRSAQAKLTDEDVISIRQARRIGVPLKVLAARYGVVESAVSRVASGTRWGHIPHQDSASCDPDNRQPVGELLITSWPPEAA